VTVRADPTAFALEYVLPDQVEHKLGVVRVRSVWRFSSLPVGADGPFVCVQDPRTAVRKPNEQVGGKRGAVHMQAHGSDVGPAAGPAYEPRALHGARGAVPPVRPRD
jgi:hypothetical protein